VAGYRWNLCRTRHTRRGRTHSGRRCEERWACSCRRRCETLQRCCERHIFAHARTGLSLCFLACLLLLPRAAHSPVPSIPRNICALRVCIPAQLLRNLDWRCLVRGHCPRAPPLPRACLPTTFRLPAFAFSWLLGIRTPAGGRGRTYTKQKIEEKEEKEKKEREKRNIPANTTTPPTPCPSTLPTTLHLLPRSATACLCCRRGGKEEEEEKKEERKGEAPRYYLFATGRYYPDENEEKGYERHGEIEKNKTKTWKKK